VVKRPQQPPLLGTSHFRVTIGRRELGFCEIGPLASTTELEPAPDRAERPHRFETVVLRRALSTSTELFDWRRRILGGRDDRRDVTIEQLDAAGGPAVNAWRLERAWPCRWSGPGFNALASAVAIEEIEPAFDDLTWLPRGDSRTSPTTTRGA
jgi:hypothetical protein